MRDRDLALLRSAGLREDVDLDRAGSLNVDQMLNASRKANSSNEVSTRLTFNYQFVDHPGYNADR